MPCLQAVFFVNRLMATNCDDSWHWCHEYIPFVLATGIQAENVHALEGLACRKRVTPASSPAAPATRVRRSRRLRSTLAAALVLLAHALVTNH